MAITGGIDAPNSLVNAIQMFIHFELRKDFTDITMSGIGVQGTLCLNIGTAHPLSDAEREEIRKRIAERFIQFIVVEQPVPL